MKLYTYFRSSAAFRVRIALNLKGVDVDMAPVHLLRKGGEQLGEEYRRINPEGLVPALVHEEDENFQQVLTQSLAIIEYLDEMYPEPPLLPSAPLDRAYVRSIALAIACDIHPLNNL
ncbi:MAG: glutathione S-transferase N-terminal domain-containing protein, partial [Noviherbaspirillum sp.]